MTAIALTGSLALVLPRVVMQRVLSSVAFAAPPKWNRRRVHVHPKPLCPRSWLPPANLGLGGALATINSYRVRAAHLATHRAVGGRGLVLR
jgi:hypothetical protein